MRNWSIFFLLSYFMLIQACGSDSSVSTNSTPTESTATVNGKVLFEAKCVVCHGSDGRAEIGGAANLATSTLTQEATAAVIANGRKSMRAYNQELSAEEIDSITAYIHTLRN